MYGFNNMWSHLISHATAALGQERGFEPFYNEFIVMRPVPMEQWVCGTDVTIEWENGLKYDNGTLTVPPFPASGNIDIHLGIGGTPWATTNLTKYTIGVQIPLDDKQFTFNVDCEALNYLCPECLDIHGKLLPADVHGIKSHTWNYLLFEDSEMIANGTGCDPNGLNYDNDTCWSTRSEGSVEITTQHEYFGVVPLEKVFSLDTWWHNDQIAPLGQHLWGVSTKLSQLVSFYNEEGLEFELEDYGKWKVEWSQYLGVIGAAIFRSLEDNIISIVFRPTRNQKLSIDDWASNFLISQNGCGEGLFEECDAGFKFHRGLVYEYEISKLHIRRELLRIINEGSPCEDTDATNWRLLYTGMSQGAGIAPIAYYDLQSYLKGQLDASVYDKIVHQLYTTGGPPQGNHTWAIHIEDTLPKWARERFVTRFDPGEGYSYGPLRIDNITVPILGTMTDLTDVVSCLNMTPPDGALTPDHAGWSWQTKEDLGDAALTDDEVMQANLTSWQHGDLVTLMRSSPACIGTTAQLLFHSRFAPVYDPVFVHWDPDQAKTWCTDAGCEGSPISPAHPNSKAPGAVYSTGYKHIDGEADRRCMNVNGPAIGPAMHCHDLGVYAYGISQLKNNLTEYEDYIAFRYGDEDFAGCKASGLMVQQISTTFTPPEITTTEDPDKASAASNLFALSIGLLIMTVFY